jgi:hypothetical protein
MTIPRSRHGNLKVNYGDDARGEVMNDAQQHLRCHLYHVHHLPTTSTAIKSGGNQDGCVFKLNPDCSPCCGQRTLVDQVMMHVTLDVHNGEVYTVGGTMSFKFSRQAAHCILHFREERWMVLLHI